MQLTRAADYAVRVMMHMANAAPGEYAGRPVLAAANGVPDSFLSKILQALARAGLVVVRRGPEGGFALSPRGRQASLLDVVEAIDGPIALNLCLEAADGCENHPWCAAHIVWTEAQQAMLKVLRGAQIADLAKQSLAHRQEFAPPVPFATKSIPARFSSDVFPAPQPRRIRIAKQGSRSGRRKR